MYDVCVSSVGEDKGYCDGVTPDSEMWLAVIRESVSECMEEDIL